MKEFTAKELHELYGKSIHVVRSFERQGFVTIDGHFIADRDERIFERLLDISIVIHDDKKLRVPAEQAYREVFKKEFQRAINEHVTTVFEEESEK